MTHNANISMLLGKNIKKIRLRKNMTQERLAELTEISVVSLSQIENNRSWPKVEILQKIVNALDVHPFELFIENESDIDRYKELVISTIVNDIDQNFPTRKHGSPRYNISHQSSKRKK